MVFCVWCICDVSVKSMAILESGQALRLLIASSDGYIKLYDVCLEVCNMQKLHNSWLFSSVSHMLLNMFASYSCLLTLQVNSATFTKFCSTEFSRLLAVVEFVNTIYVVAKLNVMKTD